MTEVIWLRSTEPGRGRPPQHSRQAITLAGVRIADQHGVGAMTMRRVAAELGTTAATLYRHVDNREDLVDLMVDHVAGEYTLGTPTGDWLQDLVDLALQGVQIHRRHPWLHDVVNTPIVGPNGLALTNTFLTMVHEHPATDSQKLIAYAIWNTIVSAIARTRHGAQSPERAAKQADYLAKVVADGHFPALAALGVMEPEDPTEVLPRVIRGVMLGLLDARP
jgi:AcrR family transcriptional regulator